MSAPSIAYLDEVLTVKKGSTTETYDLPASNYSGNIKTLFYLDFIMVCSKSDIGYIGMVEDNSSLLNYNQHNTSRFGSLRAKRRSNGKIYIVLKDGGLNTKGFVSVASLTSDLQNGGIKITITYKAAYYLGTEFYLRARIGGVGSWTDYSVKSLLEAETETDTNRNVDIDYYLPLTAGDLLEVQAYATNAEGAYYATSSTITIQPWVKAARVGATPADAYASPTTEDVYIDTKVVDLGTIFYYSDALGARYPAGFYMNEFDDFYVELNSSGEVIFLGEYIPFAPLVYTPGASRISSGSDFGDYRLTLNIVNGYATDQVSESVLFKIGYLANPGDPISDANLVTEDTYTFTSVTVPLMDEVYRQEDRNLAIPMGSNTWVYIVFKDAIQIAEGYFAI